VEDGYLFKVPIWLDGIDPKDIMVELYADGIDGAVSERIIMAPDSITDKKMEHLYHAHVITKRSVGDYTTRVISKNKSISVPLENQLILWQR
jgi:starch phosphorylase